MRVFVAGGTGFVGPAIVRAFLAAGHDVTALVHHESGALPAADARLRFVAGDVTDPASYASAVDGHDAFVHLVALRRAFPRRGLTFDRLHTMAARGAIAAAYAAGVRRFLYMSAVGVRQGGTDYQRTKWESEEALKASGLRWTIFRPTFVTGVKEGAAQGFDQEFARIARRAPALPDFGGGRFVIRPIAKRDVAAAFVAALERPVAIGKTYELAGPDAVTWREYLRTLCRTLRIRRALAPVPRGFILPVARVFERFAWFPASRDELAMLMEGADADPAPAVRDLGLDLMPWRDALREALASE
ncbi:MAG: NAD(P)H-binding protein [Thermoplasmatota archaeon]